MEGLPSKWSKLGLSARQFARQIGVTYSMAEFVVFGHQHPPCQPKAFKSKTSKDQKDIAQHLASLRSCHTTSSKVPSSRRYCGTVTRNTAGLKRYRQTQSRIKLAKRHQAKKNSSITIILNNKAGPVSSSESTVVEAFKSPSCTKSNTKAKFRKWLSTSVAHKGKTPRSRRRYIRKYTGNRLVWKRWCRNISNKIKNGRVPLQNMPARRQQKPKNKKVHSAVQVPSVIISEDLALPTDCLESSQGQDEIVSLLPGVQDKMTQSTTTKSNHEKEDCDDEVFQESEEKLIPTEEDEGLEDEEDEEEDDEDAEEETVSYGWRELFRNWLLSLETYFRI